MGLPAANDNLLIGKRRPGQPYSGRKTFEGVGDAKERILVGQQDEVFIPIDVFQHGQLSIDFPGGTNPLPAQTQNKRQIRSRLEFILQMGLGCLRKCPWPTSGNWPSKLLLIRRIYGQPAGVEVPVSLCGSRLGGVRRGTLNDAISG